jgi:putative transposase
MDQTTHKVRAEYWKGIIKECQNRPESMSAKQWMKENKICEQTYYAWQRRFRLETGALAAVQREVSVTDCGEKAVSFAEIPYRKSSAAYSTEVDSCKATAVIKNGSMTVAISNDISEALLSLILKEVAHA